MPPVKLRRFAARLSGLASGLALAVRPGYLAAPSAGGSERRAGRARLAEDDPVLCCPQPSGRGAINGPRSGTMRTRPSSPEIVSAPSYG
jgi:hypothetical protein